MTISDRVKSQFFEEDDDQRFIRISQRHVTMRATARKGTPWTHEEHERFLSALEAHPSGPWKVVASYVGTRTTRQTMTHAQKYREKIARKKKAIEIESSLRTMRYPLSASLPTPLPPTDADEQQAAATCANVSFSLSGTDVDEICDTALLSTTSYASANLSELMEVPADLWSSVMDSGEWLSGSAVEIGCDGALLSDSFS